MSSAASASAMVSACLSAFWACLRRNLDSLTIGERPPRKMLDCRSQFVGSFRFVSRRVFSRVGLARPDAVAVVEHRLRFVGFLVRHLVHNEAGVLGMPPDVVLCRIGLADFRIVVEE